MPQVFFLDVDTEVWSCCSTESTYPDSDNNSPPRSPSSGAGSSISDRIPKALVSWLVTFFLLLQARFHIRNFVLEIRFHFLKAFLVALGRVKHWEVIPCNTL